MKLHLCGVVAATILLSGCGQMGPLVLASKADTPKTTARKKTPVTVQPPVAPPSSTDTPASGVNPTPVEPNKDTP